jgi:hypothetical protein
MNCDTAFDLLTDAEGSRSLALARHLDDCPRCRQMRETLAPALEYLWADGAPAPAREFSGVFEAGREGKRPAFVTVEALSVARQAAADLMTRATSPRARWRLLAARSLQYAAVFAAGLFVASALFEMREHPAPAGKVCTRDEARRIDVQRSDAEIRTLVLSCAACHDARPAAPPDRSAMLGPGTAVEEWLYQLLREETLLAIAGEPAFFACRDLS